MHRTTLFVVIALTSCSGTPRGELRAVSPSELSMTKGPHDLISTMEHGALHIDAGGMRATATSASNVVELRFTYRGPSTTSTPLASGELRRQIGLKLRAKDTCNVVYAMWHIEPTPRVVVSIKRNPGATTHAECGDRGYRTIDPLRAIVPTTVVTLNEPHTLRAIVEGETLRIFTDGVVAWSGPFPRDAFEMEGPVGMRTDNGVFETNLLVGRPEGRAQAARNTEQGKDRPYE